MTNEVKIQLTEKYRYLGKTLMADWKSEIEVKRRIAMSKEAFNKRKNLFSSSMDLENRKLLVKCYVWSILLYRCETWALEKSKKYRMKAFKM